MYVFLTALCCLLTGLGACTTRSIATKAMAFYATKAMAFYGLGKQDCFLKGLLIGMTLKKSMSPGDYLAKAEMNAELLVV